MKSFVRGLLAGALILAASVHAQPAAACFDGYSVSSERLFATVMTDGVWQLSQARGMARWAAKFDALIPAGFSLRLEGTYAIELCNEHDECEPVQVFNSHEEMSAPRTHEQFMERVFQRTAKHVNASRQEVALARSRAAVLYAVQIGSFKSRRAAVAVAEKFNFNQPEDDIWAVRRFYSAGGYPAVHAAANVVPIALAGVTYQRVNVGLFFDAAKAQAYQARIAKRGYRSSLSVEHIAP